MNGDPRMIVAQRRMVDRWAQADEARLARISRLRSATKEHSRPALGAGLVARLGALAARRPALPVISPVKVGPSRP